MGVRNLDFDGKIPNVVWVLDFVGKIHGQILNGVWNLEFDGKISGGGFRRQKC